MKARHMFYKEFISYKRIAEMFGVHPNTIQKAVKGMGAFYGSIEDDIPQYVKDSHVQSNQKYSIARSMRMVKRVHTEGLRRTKHDNSLG